MFSAALGLLHPPGGYHHDLSVSRRIYARAFPTRTNVAGIEISGGSGFRISNTKVAGLGSERYAFGIGVGGKSLGNYFENDYVVSCVQTSK